MAASETRVHARVFEITVISVATKHQGHAAETSYDCSAQDCQIRAVPHALSLQSLHYDTWYHRQRHECDETRNDTRVATSAHKIPTDAVQLYMCHDRRTP